LQNPAFIESRSIIVFFIVFIFVAFFHEGGHYYATKYYSPKEKNESHLRKNIYN
jgi:hypothetical protein